jgi:Zn-dependent protease/predicted transcriptional regulator
MSWSWKIGRVAGIEVRIHATFLILLVWVAAAEFLSGHGARAALLGTLLLLAVFGIVVLHELGHALAARRFGIRTRDITLLPIGGVSRLESMPSDPRQELLVALAGPAVNGALALLCAGYLFLRGEAGLLSEGFAPGVSIAGTLFWTNVSLAVFNLLPAFPMDGGRALRAFLATRMEGSRATQIAARLGQGLALVFGAFGLFFNPLLVFIALFVWMGATQEAAASELREAIQATPVRAAMITDLRTLTPDQPLGDAVRHVLAGFQQDFPVLEGERVVGVLTRKDLVRTLSERGDEAPVRDAMHTEFATAEPAELLSDAFERLDRADSRTVPVLQGSKLVGVLTMDNVGELVMFRSALRNPGSGRPAFRDDPLSSPG